MASKVPLVHVSVVPDWGGGITMDRMALGRPTDLFALILFQILPQFGDEALNLKEE